MNVLQDVLTWAEGLPAWQSDALRRLFENDTLSSEAETEIYSILKAECGIHSSTPLTVKRLSKQVIPFGAGQAAAKKIAIKGMGNLKNVNALQESQTLKFGETGLTTTYGDNGVGKTGYGRALKRACRARDSKEKILPNVFKASSGKPSASFHLSVEGTDHHEPWEDGGEPSELLATVAVFDAKCARAYLDEENALAYIPYGLESLDRLTKLCARLKARAQLELEILDLDQTFYSEIDRDSDIGKLISNLSAATDKTKLEEIGALSNDDVIRLSDLRKQLAADNPKTRADLLFRQKRRIEALAASVSFFEEALSASRLENYRVLKCDSDDKAAAAKLAAANVFSSSPLSGVGGGPWKVLFEAARKYSESEAFPNRTFPVTEGEDSRCVLCQQALSDEAATRMKAFQSFIAADIATGAKSSLQSLETALRALDELDTKPKINHHDAIEDVRTLNPDMAVSIENFFDSCISRSLEIKRACKDGQWAAIPALSDVSTENLKSLVQRVQDEAEAMNRLASGDERKHLETEFRDLQAKAKFLEHKTRILKLVDNLKLKSQLDQCVSALNTTWLSRKLSEFTEKAVTEELKVSLEKEFSNLKLNHLQLGVGQATRTGTTSYKLLLQGVVVRGPSVSEVLSDGEQRALAIAAFFAELKTLPSVSAIVFDDPISSLDHHRREIVAKRLVHEAQTRQVIVFTHDLVFLAALLDESAKLQVTLTTQHIVRDASGAGRCLDGLPWKGKNAKQRVGELRSLAQEAQIALNAGDEETYEMMARRAYEKLRETWERSIEEVLFNSVILRFRQGVETQRAIGVSVEDSDILQINLAMSHCSKFCHDEAAAMNRPAPEIEVLKRDIEDFETFRAAIEKRKELVASRRKSMFEAPKLQTPLVTA